MAIKFEFEDVAFDPGSRRLGVNGADVHLSPKAFELLALLIERRPAAVSKADIHARLWPSTHVSESSLPSLVSEIREALDDRRREPRLIRTVHGFGYALQRDRPDPAQAKATDGAPRGWLVGSIAELALTPGDNVFGREGAGVIVLSSTAVSRRHARIRVDGSGVVVEDLGSKNGTFVNDRRVEGPTPVRDGDQVRLGSVLFTFRSATAVESTQTASTGVRRPAPGA